MRMMMMMNGLCENISCRPCPATRKYIMQPHQSLAPRNIQTSIRPIRIQNKNTPEPLATLHFEEQTSKQTNDQK